MEVKQPNGTIDTMIRQTRVHHMQLSIMADFKANILLTVSALVLPFAASFHDNPNMMWAMRILILCCVATILLAIYAVMPKLPLRRGKVAPADVDSPTFNLLFFGDFMRLGQDQFEQAMERVLNDTDQAYAAMVRELYTMGQYLAEKKYRFLGYAYLSFIVGVVGCFVALVVDHAI